MTTPQEESLGFQSVVKISSDYVTIEDLIMNPEELDFNEVAIGISRMTFSIPVYSERAKSIKELKKIALYRIADGKDTLEWTGYVVDVEYDFEFVKVICEDEKSFFRKRINASTKNHTAKTLSFIVDQLLSESNARSGESFSFTSDITDTFTKKFEVGRDYTSILEELAELSGGEFNISLGVVTMNNQLGIDRTVGEDFFELISNLNSPLESNVSNIKYKKTSRTIATWILGKAGGSTSIQSDPSTEFGHVEKYAFYSEGDVAVQTAEDLAKSKVSQLQLEIKTLPVIAYEAADVFDAINLRVERESDILDTEGVVRVIEKKTIVRKGNYAVELTVSEIIKDPSVLLSAFKALADDVKLLKTLV